MSEETTKITIIRDLDDSRMDMTMDIPTKFIDRCEFDNIGAVVGVDYVDQYLRDVHNIWCEDWWIHNIASDWFLNGANKEVK